MSHLQGIISELYEKAKIGKWTHVMSVWEKAPRLAQHCSHFQKASSGWTFLHQAAFFDQEGACRTMIRFGADPSKLSTTRQRACDVAKERKNFALSKLILRATQPDETPWSPVDDPYTLPSSNLWEEASERMASEELFVTYGGSIIYIAPESRYFVDSFERTLVGWHGSYNPPCGMDGEPIALSNIG
ncbi:hypothetical protein Q4508_19425 [Amphritea sp. 2_MG-2023]|uniref:hypothetical protein n=1 Tax=Amphritea TaxID=515417 RepID=UPI001C067C96|nr:MULTISPECIES: hypothetical protein [Amphritea]MBU2965238.1 hypothetical protein [Amphritea atlantica]MDO6420731.1 hypothetical protein [Amphritea sp. 2_MG-2023]